MLQASNQDSERKHLISCADRISWCNKEGNAELKLSFGQSENTYSTFWISTRCERTRQKCKIGQRLYISSAKWIMKEKISLSQSWPELSIRMKLNQSSKDMGRWSNALPRRRISLEFWTTGYHRMKRGQWVERRGDTSASINMQIRLTLIIRKLCVLFDVARLTAPLVVSLRPTRERVE